MKEDLRVLEEKAAIREQIRALRRQLSLRTRHEAARHITTSVTALDQWKDARTVSLYASTPEEVNTSALIHAAFADRKIVVLPQTILSGLILRTITDLSELHMTASGIAEPSPANHAVLPIDVDLFIVPGVAYGREGLDRVGMGGGHYDALLPATRGFKIGLGYDFQVLAGVPHIPYHDIPMDMVVTERGRYGKAKAS